MSHNSLTKIPVMSLTNLAALTMCELDLSHNSIAAIHSMDLSNKFRVSCSNIDFYLNWILNLMLRLLAVLVALEFGVQSFVPFGRCCVCNIATPIESRFVA